MATALLVVFISLVVAAMGFSLYVRKAREYLVASEPAWNRLFDSAKATIQDSAMPREMVAFATAAVMCAGCGCLTVRILFDEFFGRRERKKPRSNNRAAELYDSLTPEQRTTFSRVVTNAIYYDSLRAPLSGFLLRRLVAPWLRAAAEEREFIPEKGRVASMAESTRKAIAHRAEGKRFLQMAH